MAQKPVVESVERGKRGIYYGWVIVGVAALLQFAGGTPTFPVLGLFLEPMTDEMGWSRTAFVTPMTIGTILGGFAGALVGPAIDKHGARWVMTIAAVLLGAAFILMGFVHELWQHFLLQIVIRCLTAGAFFLVIGIIVPKWFVAMRGRAMAFSSMGGRFGQFLNPVIVGWVIINVGWRYAWAVMGVLVWAVAIVPVFFFLKSTPEAMGLLPDGVTPEQAAAAKEQQGKQGTRKAPVEVSIGPREALRTRTFYLMLIAQSALSLVISGLHFHWFAYMTGQGISDSVAIASISVSSIIGIPISLVAGFLAERFQLRYIFVVTYLGFSLAVLVLLFTTSPLMAYVYGITLGVFSGVTFTINQVIWADYYGRGSLGAIRGLTSPVNQVTNALGPVVAAIVFDATGSYGVILWTFVAITALTSGFWLLATPPKPVTAMPAKDELNNMSKGAEGGST